MLRFELFGHLGASAGMSGGYLFMFQSRSTR